MRTGVAISSAAHITVMVLATIVISSSPPPITQPPPMSVALLTTSDESKIAGGVQEAPQVERPRPLVERVAESRPVEDPSAKIVNNAKEITAATDAASPPPLPQPKQLPKKAEPKQAEQKQAEHKKAEPKKAEPKRDVIAEAIKKDTAKKAEQKKSEQKKAEQKKAEQHRAETPPVPPRRPAHKAEPKFDRRQIQALLDKRTPQRKEATGDAINNVLTLGAPVATAAHLSQSELDALRARLAQLWNPPVGARNPQELVVTIRLRLKRDGTLADGPQVVTSGHSDLFLASRDSALRAVFRGQPFDMLRPETYEQWRDIEITFDPREMIRG